MGNDGLAASPVNAKVGRDAFSYSLNYFAGDYAAIEATKWSSVANRFEAGRTNSYLFNARNDLYNGNISAMVTNMAQPKLYTSAANEQPTLQPQGMAYKYDQLNRIKNANAYTNLNTTNNEWETTGGVPANYYRNTFTYDGNGNILNQTRYAQTTLIDDLSYKYTRDANQKLLRNQLNYVTDAVVGSTPTDDIESQGINNYKYDEIGNLRKDSTEQIEFIEWNVYGKIKKIKRYLTSTKSNLEFVYDPSGNRIAKIEKPDGTSVENGAASDQVGNWKITYYVRDATGNVMGNYYQTTVSGLPSHKLTEHPIYGSSRLGSDNTQLEMIAAVIPSPFTRTIGNKYFEGVNHLGNVLSVYTDKKIPRDDNSDGTVDYYQAEVVSCSDYTPFGAPMNERTFSSNKYRYGFNGKENDNEVKGQGNQQDYGMRIYDNRLGRFLSVDPLTADYPELTPYQFASNRPIDGIDLDGLEYHQNAAPGEEINGVLTPAKDNTAVTLNEKQVMAAMTAKAYVKPEPDKTQYVGAKYDPAQANFDYNVKLYGPLAPGYTPLTKYLKGEKITKTDWTLEAIGIIPIGKIGGLAFKGLVKGTSALTKIGGFATEKLLNSHFAKHAGEFGGLFKNADEYLAGAQDFFKQTSDDIIEYSRKNGDVVRYNKADNTFGVAQSDGTIRTFFKPKDGLDYFKGEVVKDVGEDAAKLIK